MKAATTTTNLSYALVTPARNEESHIEKTIKSVISQNAPPVQWVIVSDGSIDLTDEIVQDYAFSHRFIQLVRVTGQNHRNFGSKVAAFNAGYKTLASEDYAFIGNLDADVSFGSGYYEHLLKIFGEQPDLGIAGGLILELVGQRFVSQNISLNSVAGAVQLFRRSCFEAIGGYVPLQEGDIDAAAEIMARMQGWKVRTFTELKVLHHRRVGIGRNHLCGTRFRQGMNNYRLGYHALFQLASSVYRIREKPYLVGGMLTLLGYVWAYCRGYEISLPEDVVRYLRCEQMTRLKSSVSSMGQE